MVQFTFKSSVLLAFVLLAQGAPLYKRIAQNTPDSKTAWEAACRTAGGADKCNTIAVNAIGTLLAAADPCAQQNSADQMIDLAKQLNNDADMIKLAQIFAQQPRNSPDSLSVPYCQQAPKNKELDGLFQCQFQGVNPKTFFKNTAVGQPGTIPFGQNKPLDPAGSCPAHPDGPIPDGQQLVDIVGGASGDSGAGNASNGSGNASASAPSASSSAADPNATVPPANNAGNDPAATSSASAPQATTTSTGGAGEDPTPSDEPCEDDPTATEDPSATATEDPSASGTAASATTEATAAPTASTGGSGSGSGDFHQQNAKDAQALNAKFATLTKDSSCTDGDQACVEGGFAQCVGGKFQLTGCPASTKCFALPLVNKPGTSIACDFENDAGDRITQSGGQGGVAGNGN